MFTIFCSHSDADMTFTPSVEGGIKGTKITEILTLASSPIMKWLTVSEVRRQRVLIAEQLKDIDFTVDPA
jgi:hypothetical protein